MRKHGRLGRVARRITCLAAIGSRAVGNGDGGGGVGATHWHPAGRSRERGVGGYLANAR